MASATTPGGSLLNGGSSYTRSMVKAKFRDHIRSKTDTAMKNEALCKFLCHNVCCLIQEMHELGIAPEFGRDAR